MPKKATSVFLLSIVLLTLLSLACSQAGEVLAPAEATARAEAAAPQIEILDSGSDGGPAVGDVVKVTGTGFLVNLRDNPGGGISGSIARSSEVTIVSVAGLEGETWYQIDSDAGQGWLDVKSIEIIEIETEEDEAGDAVDSGPAPAFAAGDVVEVTGTGFLVNIMDNAGSERIIGGLPKNAPVEILEVAAVEEAIWYHITGDAGEGWLPEENILTPEE